MGLVAAQLRLGLVDVFLARAGDRQFERLPVDLDPRIRNAGGGLGCVGILLAGKVLAEQRTLALELPARVDRIGLGGLQIGLGLRDLLGPAAVAQPVHHGALRRDLRSHLGYLRFQATGIETRQHFPFVHPVALLNQNGGDALVVVEGQGDLAQIDVAVQDELHRRAVAVGEPPSRSAGAGRGRKERDDQEPPSQPPVRCRGADVGRTAHPTFVLGRGHPVLGRFLSASH